MFESRQKVSKWAGVRSFFVKSRLDSQSFGPSVEFSLGARAGSLVPFEGLLNLIMDWWLFFVLKSRYLTLILDPSHNQFCGLEED